MMVIRTIFLSVFLSVFINCDAQTSEVDHSFSAAINGEQLVKLGRKLHKPILSLIGMTLRNLHPCDDWTPWSPCGQRYERFGSRTRSRKCDHNRADITKPTTEVDTKLCEGNCPIGYNITKHGYCLKLSFAKMSYTDAKNHCKLDGGFLINVGTQEKYEDVQEIMQGLNEYIRIGGYRKDISSSWVYEYGSQNGLLTWDVGQPNKNSADLCLLMSGVTKLWHDGGCAGHCKFICEVVSM